jgi:hypothetical protein
MAANLNDTQRIILATAAARDSLDILPLPKGLRAPPVAVQRTLKALIAAGFVIETGEDGARITPAGLAAMRIDTSGVSPDAQADTHTDAGVPPEAEGAPDHRPASASEVSAPEGETGGTGTSEVAGAAKPDRPLSKSKLVVEMLRRQGGASIAEISEATGWQAHSVRGFLTASVKGRMNLPLVSGKAEDGVRRYHIAAIRTGEAS